MLTNEVDALIHGLATQVARRYRMVVRDDLLQQGRLWVLAHPLRMEAWLSDDDAASWRKMSEAIAAELEAYAHREKAAKLGYELEDEAYYTVEMIEELLPAVFDPDRETAPVLEQQEVRAPSDPAISAVWPCHLADVSAALVKCSMGPYVRASIVFRYADGLTDYEIAAWLRQAGEDDVTYDDVAVMIQQGLRAMVHYLGGDRPRPCGRSCHECHGSLLTSV